jgi:hypothetical protein
MSFLFLGRYGFIQESVGRLSAYPYGSRREERKIVV